MTLVEFLRTRLDEDEAAARAWLPFGNPDEAARNHIARHDPARVLAEVEAKRRILYEHRDDGYGDCLGCGMNALEEMCREIDDCPTLLALAAVYATHPDYQAEWRLD